MTDIPVGITHGYVSGAFNEIVRDSGDAGSVPDAVPLEGTVEARWLGREIAGDTPRLDKTRHLVESGAMFVVQDYVGDTALAVTAGQLPATALVSGWWQLTYQLSGVDLWRYEVRVGTESEGAPLNIALAPADAPPAVIAASAALVESLKAEVENTLATFGNRLGGVEDTASVAGTQATNAAASANAASQAASASQTAAQNAQTAASDAQAVAQDVNNRIPTAEKGAASGVATLDGTTKVPVAQIPKLSYGQTNGLSTYLTDLKKDITERSTFTVTRFGAGKVSTGVFNCSDYPSHNACIQAAIDAAEAAGGGQVRIAKGYYEIEDEIIVKERVWIVGDGLGTRLEFKTGINFTGKYMFRTDDFTCLKDLQVDGNGISDVNPTGVTGGSFLKIEGTGCWFKSMRIINFDEKGIYGIREAPTTQHPNGKPVHANKVESLWMVKCKQYAIHLVDGTADMEFDQIWIANGNTGIRLESGQHEISNLHIWETDQNAMEIASTSSFVWMSNAYIESNMGWGLVIEGQYVTISGGRIWKNGYDNTVTTTGGIKVDGGSRVSFMGVLFHENNGPGLYLTGNTQKWSAVGCHFVDPRGTKTQTYGIQCTAGVNYGTLAANTCLPADHLNGGMALGNHGGYLEAFGNFGYADTLTLSKMIDRHAGSKFAVGSDGGLSWSDGTNAADTTLVRAAGGELELSKRLSIAAAGSLNTGLSVTAPGTTVDRLAVNGAGQMHWSGGTAAADTKLYRNGSGQLRTDGEMLTNEVSAAKSGQRRSYVGATSSGPPTTGTYDAGDFATSLDGGLHVCTAGGTPGTWVTK